MVLSTLGKCSQLVIFKNLSSGLGLSADEIFIKSGCGKLCNEFLEMFKLGFKCKSELDLSKLDFSLVIAPWMGCVGWYFLVGVKPGLIGESTKNWPENGMLNLGGGMLRTDAVGISASTEILGVLAVMGSNSPVVSEISGSSSSKFKYFLLIFRFKLNSKGHGY